MYASYSQNNYRSVRVAVIGAGNRARKYLEYAVMHPDELEIVAIVDPVEIRLHQLSDKFNIPEENRFGDYHDFFAANIDLDAVMICTPEDKHFEPAMMAIDKGYNILLEKPIAQTLEECEAIAKGAKELDARGFGLISVAQLALNADQKDLAKKFLDEAKKVVGPLTKEKSDRGAELESECSKLAERL